MTTAAVVLAALAYGIGSALIPVLNAEAYAAATALLLDGMDVVWMVVALSLGTVVGKVVLFQAARAGRDLSRRRPPREPRTGRLARGIQRVGAILIGWLDDPLRAVVTVLASAFIGIPPLLAVAVLAGASRMRVVVFAAAVLVGRAGRFVLIAGAAHGLV